MTHEKAPVDIRILSSLYQDPAVVLIRLVKPSLTLKIPGLMIELLDFLQSAALPLSFKTFDALLDIGCFLAQFFNIVSNLPLLLQKCPGSFANLPQLCSIFLLDILHPDHKVVGQLLALARIHLHRIELADDLALGLYLGQCVILSTQDAVRNGL